ncbi:hypothetical protein [Thioalkalivibrio sp. ALE20]|uniref:hypothetical protein n=1 Tax=Thioalkalivibrio sp. ALE20 TaxID=545275 RepID=UPI0018DD80DC|nr:hypothetical protein [Thioalkalivibrio sp. ALE20]
MTDENGPRWRYERGEGRTKHLWHNDYAGFEPSPKGPVGKCPKSITRDLAEELLNKEAIPFYESEDSQWPDRFHAVYRGVIYEAVPTQPGYSYHAYPWRGDLRGPTFLTRKTLKALREKADKRGKTKELESWLRQFGGALR